VVLSTPLQLRVFQFLCITERVDFADTGEKEDFIFVLDKDEENKTQKINNFQGQQKVYPWLEVVDSCAVNQQELNPETE
jgi:hypothetical protein